MKNRPHIIKHGLRAFTMVEILVAMLISSILVLGIHAAHRQARLVFYQVQDRLPIFREGRMITELLRNELTGVYLPPEAQPQEGDNESQNTNSFNLLSLPDATSVLEFYTLTPSRRGHLATSRMARISYSYAEGNLTRIEQAYSGEKKLGPQYTDIISSNLAEMSYAAFDAGAREWKPSFSSGRAPPKAIKITLYIKSKKNIPKTEFATTVFIPTQAALMKENK